MKKFLPNSVNNPQGFTLIELLVVISIIAILAVIGFVAYTGITARGRDAKRIAEINSIQKAMEKNYQPGVGYVVLKTTDFQDGSIPTDPLTGQLKCGVSSGTPPVLGVCDYCVVGAVGNYATCTNKVSGSQPPAGTSYTVCANLETAAGKNGATYYCLPNAQ